MRKIDYRRDKLVWPSLVTGAIAYSSFTMPSAIDPMNVVTTFWICISAIFGVLCVFTSLKALTGGTAIAFDEHGVELHTIFTGHRLSWAEVENLEARQKTFYAFGFLPTGSISYLRVTTKGGLFGHKTIRITPDLLDLPKFALPHVFAEMVRLRDGVGAAVTALEADSNEADAIIARYLAAKEHQPAAGSRIWPATPATSTRSFRPRFGRRRSA